ncbi:MAG: 6,7-dimethyl-8-ribityllumazine synthase [Bifidobacteriaceae bacterium]|jgi:6,7-dimethyl-8-ribityllumazine synthase|nr:6,7-dimethyl-8-ribityllumazine synthase [Bifidobacteriaceae bacterium]
MSGPGAPALAVSGVDPVSGQPWSIAVVASLWHREIMDGLVAGAERALRQSGAEHRLFRVPGAFELPLAARWTLAQMPAEPSAAPPYGADAVVALGVVIRGGTPHFEYVCQAATAGLAQVALESNKPVGFGLLTCDNEAEARDRAGLGGAREDKGAQAAEAVLAMLRLRAGQ